MLLKGTPSASATIIIQVVRSPPPMSAAPVLIVTDPSVWTVTTAVIAPLAAPLLQVKQASPIPRCALLVSAAPFFHPFHRSFHLNSSAPRSSASRKPLLE